MDSFKLTPSVDSTQEFIEIAYDFSNPLDIIRENISNSFDFGATNMEIIFNTILKVEKSSCYNVKRQW